MSVAYLKALSEVDKVTIMRRNAAFASCLREYGSQDYEGVIHAIIVRFIQPGVPEEINIDSATREKILAAHREGICDTETFSRAQQQCYDLMLTNSLPRFLKHVSKNVGADEIAVRMAGAICFGIVTVGLIVTGFVLPHYPRGARWAVLFPAAMTLLLGQATFSGFCPVYGFVRQARMVGRGFPGFEKPGCRTCIEEKAIRSAHLHRALLATTLAALFGILVAAITFAIPFTRR
ncbi:hypothetical protein PUNSTDRAFT_49247 [Punctularia strigosozonata HHB-11173 SS5]|uniref:uncharacterized protein n=1 Tax=Punctularia strigosozonata (strain HHB-11173) TaxID=741275 RepID=UPI0004418025|nr:uncharacterized protein PUNSTDRAFT_49247 [Punctularia strigosozonata HHB-11173 SS5]EIN14459.1 hypothetical protein PUNSTDRAFT_49247 [Punctularia strigosozonata HHB-11173 SS5]